MLHFSVLLTYDEYMIEHLAENLNDSALFIHRNTQFCVLKPIIQIDRLIKLHKK